MVNGGKYLYKSFNSHIYMQTLSVSISEKVTDDENLCITSLRYLLGMLLCECCCSCSDSSDGMVYMMRIDYTQSLIRVTTTRVLYRLKREMKRKVNKFCKSKITLTHFMMMGVSSKIWLHTWLSEIPWIPCLLLGLAFLFFAFNKMYHKRTNRYT